MKKFLVGGCVRDKLMGAVIQDHDYVVVGSTPEEMLEKGFEQVGAAFPVFLHPETREEHALARVEAKVGQGYHGFACDTTTSMIPQELLDAFIQQGYELDEDYSIAELIEVFQHIIQSDVLFLL